MLVFQLKPFFHPEGAPPVLHGTILLPRFVPTATSLMRASANLPSLLDRLRFFDRLPFYVFFPLQPRNRQFGEFPGLVLPLNYFSSEIFPPVPLLIGPP